MACMAQQNLWPYSDFVADSILAKSVSKSCGTPMVMPYVATCAAFSVQLQELHIDADFLA